MKIIELILDEENDDVGVTAISVVENPAIEDQFLAKSTTLPSKTKKKGF